MIERSKDVLFPAVPHHDYPVGFFGTGNTVEEVYFLQILGLSYVNPVKEIFFNID